jgi:altronate dehydratase
VTERRFILSHPEDNVVTCLEEMEEGDFLRLSSGEILKARERIPFGHKMAICYIGRGDPVVKYGEKIGAATGEVMPGHHVHTHNLRSVRGGFGIAPSVSPHEESRI